MRRYNFKYEKYDRGWGSKINMAGGWGRVIAKIFPEFSIG